ncbi:MAG: hypothetical protein MR442_03550 [Lachnospiraceae bacterium]|nr:hypothetical protein [Lachnospiraceae bacterium]
MATKFSIPSSPSRSVLTISTFLGADFTNSPAAVSENQSPNCKNMIRDVPGKVRKCMGYKKIAEYDDQINGYHYIRGEQYGLVHAGTKMYYNGVVKYSDANNARSRSWQFDNKLYIVDGKKLLVWDGAEVKPASEYAKIPTVTIAKAPNGGGTSYEDLNLIQPGFTELFAGTEGDTAYHMTFGGLDDTTVKAYILDSSGSWAEKTENTDFTVDRENGIINFTAAPGKSPVTGEDNVKITAYRTVSGYADRINKCCIGTQYGLKGSMDRLFLSGNPDYINQDWFSDQNDPTYFADTYYSSLGTSKSAIMGYSVINNYLATHKDEMETDQFIVLREGVLADNKPVFRSVNTLQGAGAIAKDTFAYLSSEPLFLTRSGVYAITAQDITGEKYGQNRSFYLNGKLLKESDLEKSFAFVYKDMYWLCVNGVAYILDGLQPMQTDKSMPYSTRQYAGFYRTNLPANCMWEKDGNLYFGSTDGRVCEFYSDSDALVSYNDDGEKIEAIWETPDLDGKLFYKNKTFRYLAVRLKSAVATTLEMYVQKRGLWSFIKKDNYTARYLSFGSVVFSKFTFSSDQTQKIIPTKLRVKKVDKARFRFVNAELNEPFGLFDIALEYVENGNHK